MNLHSSLPDPDPSALERSRALGAMVRAEINAAPGQVIGFDRYMELVLYTPELGYYSADNSIFGASGDFVTAPESGLLFGRCLARQCAELLERSSDAVVVEYGAGSGALMLTILEHLQAEQSLPAEYHVVETSAPLRERQRDLLATRAPQWRDRVTWHSSHPAADLDAVVIANEVLDAMPAKRYVVVEGQVREFGVGLRGDALVFSTREQGQVPDALAQALAGHAEGYCSEAIAALDEWCAALRSYLRRGSVLLCDYGYPRHEFHHVDRASGTLKCHYRHQVHGDPFVLPGLQDLTVAVNFTDLAEAASAAGFEVAGYTTQAHFLLDCGLEGIMASAMRGDPAQDYALAQEAKRLLLPGEMGQTCKVMALSVDGEGELLGFGHDERQRLDGFIAGGAR